VPAQRLEFHGQGHVAARTLPSRLVEIKAADGRYLPPDLNPTADDDRLPEAEDAPERA